MHRTGLGVGGYRKFALQSSYHFMLDSSLDS